MDVEAGVLTLEYLNKIDPIGDEQVDIYPAETLSLSSFYILYTTQRIGFLMTLQNKNKPPQKGVRVI